MADLSNFDSARQTFSRLNGGRGGGGGRGFGGGGGGRGFGGRGGGRGFGGGRGGGRGFGGGRGGGRGFGGGRGGKPWLNWHGGYGYGRGYPYFSGLYSYPYYDYLTYLPVAVESETCNQGPTSQQPVTFYNGQCVEDQATLERFASELNCCPGTVVRPMPGSSCESNGDVSRRMYHCAYN